MNQLYSCLVDRREFGELLSTDGVDRLHREYAPNIQTLLLRLPRDQSLLAVWSQNSGSGNQLPNLLVCQDGKENDWAAWITTYAAKLRPFSAFMRLITTSELKDMVTVAQSPDLGRLTWPAVGIVIGEVLAASRMPDKSVETLPVTAYASTLSFAMFRAAAIYPSFKLWPQLVDAWETTRQATRQQQRPVETQAIARVCATVIEAGELGDTDPAFTPSNRDLSLLCRQLFTSPDLVFSSLLSLPNVSSLQKRMEGPREGRVIAFSEFASSLEELPSINRELVSFLLGFLASRIAPGTIQHSAVLDSVTRRFPTATIWYGLCAGLGGQETAANKMFLANQTRPTLDLPPSARWIARDLLRPESFMDTPSCDIAFRELLALSRTGDDPLFGLIRKAQGNATIELFPAIWTVVNIHSKPASEEFQRTTREKEILASMGESLEKLRSDYNDLLRNDTGAPPQRSLFQAKRKKT